MVLGFWISVFIAIISCTILFINIFHNYYFDSDTVAWVFGILEAISVFGIFFFGYYSGMLK
jgi:hypothetical protein